MVLDGGGLLLDERLVEARVELLLREAAEDARGGVAFKLLSKQQQQQQQQDTCSCFLSKHTSTTIKQGTQ